MFTVILPFFLSCDKINDELTASVGSQYLRTIPEKVSADQNIKIILSSKDANKHDYYANILSVNNDGNYYQYRIKFSRDNSSSIVIFHVPTNSEFLKIDYERKNEIEPNPSLTKVVHKNDKPSLTGLVLSLRNSKTLVELDSLHRINESLYPDNKLSWAMASQIQSKFIGMNFPESEVDSVYDIVKKHNDECGLKDQFDNLSACFHGYCKIKNWNKAHSILIKMKLPKYSKIVPSWVTNDNIMTFIRENSAKSLIKYERLDVTENVNNIYLELFSWKEINNTRQFRNETIKRIDSVAAINPIFDDYLNDLYHIYMNPAGIDTDYEYTNYYNFIDILKYRQEYSKAIEIGKKAIDIMNEMNKKELWSQTTVVEGSLSPMGGIYGGVLSRTAECAILNNNDSLAIVLYKKLINTEVDSDNLKYIQGSISLATISLTKLYIRLGLFDSAKESLKKAFEYKSPYAERTYQYLQNSLKKAGKETFAIDEIIDFEEIQPIAPDYKVKSAGGVYNLNDSLSPLTLLFFLSGSCASCDDPTFRAIDILNSYPDIRKNILIVAEEKQLEMFAGMGENVLLVKKNDSLLNKFKIKTLPSVVVVKNGRIFRKEDNITTSENAWLYYLGLY